ncbi:MAG: ABC transporter substrate-binding protein [Gammaproteobacteria bacterium]|nr:ABC transporter substrate-binding protein [Gammaproteobacteria bacterium]
MMTVKFMKLCAPAIAAVFVAPAVVALCIAANANAQTYIEPPYLAAQVAAGDLPAVAQRVPRQPATANFDAHGLRSGQYGGTMRMLMGKTKDIRMMMVYGYARLIGYDRELNLVADLLESYEVTAQRVFTLRLRKGHRWSDGEPFTTQAFRYYWEDIVTNEELYPFGLPKQLLVDGEAPTVEFIDAVTVRYSWSKANPYFLTALAAPRPLFLYAPGHYLKQFHADYAAPADLEAKIKQAGVRNWAGLHHRKNHPYKNDNPELPVLQPWVNTTRPPAERFIFTRNPYYHRVDGNGRQLPYIDQVSIHIASSSLVAAKTAAGESDLQGRYLRLDDYTFLKAGESRNDFSVRLWQHGSGSQLALYPNLNSNDPAWRRLTRARDFRRALSLGINRFEINQVIYYGLATESNNTVLAGSPLFAPEYQTAWSRFDPAEANRMLDNLGLDKRDDRGLRLMPDGTPLEIILHTAGESTEETDILELIGESWRALGIKLHTKPSQREVFRERVFAGEAMMAMWGGVDNGLPTADMSPEEFAPTGQTQLQWPKWGQHFESSGQVGEPPDLPAAVELLDLYHQWNRASEPQQKRAVWRDMLGIHSREVFSIGLVCGVPQPVVVSNRLRNVPQTGIYGWLPTAYFGVYRPDGFWFE